MSSRTVNHGDLRWTNGLHRRIFPAEKFKSLLRRRARPEHAVALIPPISFHSPEQDNEPTALDAQGSDVVNSPCSRDSLISDESSLMLYSPLQPSQELAVEIAVSEWREWRPATFEELFEFDNDRREREDGQEVESGEADHLDARDQKYQVRIWIPSRTQLSFQFLWWGYRMSGFDLCSLCAIF
jgi:hypothetical protein